VIRRGDDLAQLGPRDGAADRDVDMRGKPSLWLDSREVLDLVSEEAAQVLDEPVEQRGEVQRIPSRAGVS